MERQSGTSWRDLRRRPAFVGAMLGLAMIPVGWIVLNFIGLYGLPLLCLALPARAITGDWWGPPWTRVWFYVVNTGIWSALYVALRSSGRWRWYVRAGAVLVWTALAWFSMVSIAKELTG